MPAEKYGFGQLNKGHFDEIPIYQWTSPFSVPLLTTKKKDNNTL
jgi:hypothetical protein